LSDDQMTLDLKSYYAGGQYFSYLQSKLSLREKNHVSFISWVPHKLVLNYYQDAAVYLSASICNEAGNMPVIEAMASGIPVVSSRSGGIIESVVDGETGFLVERGDATGLAMAIIRLLSDEKLRKKMGKAAYKRAIEIFSWEQAAELLSLFYKEISDEKIKLP
jgi:glycosyltransferase involved in cell wall biosynthesis